MKKTIIYIQLIAVLVMLNLTSAQAQIIQFSQFYAAPLYLAPSYAGECYSSRVSLNYRNQWPEIGMFNTYALAYDQNLHKINSGVGVMILRDDAGDGDLALTTIDICYSWWTKINPQWTLRPGIGIKYNQRSIQFEHLIFGDMYNELGELNQKVTNEQPPMPHKPFLDMQVSCLGYCDKYWAGISVDHLLRPKASLYDNNTYHEDMKLTFFGGAKIYVGPQTASRGRDKSTLQSVSFTILYDYSKLSDNLYLGAYWHKEPFTLGAWIKGIPIAVRKDTYSNIDALVVMLGYRIFNFHVGYSYDFTIGHLLSSTGGSHEVSLQYEFQAKARAKQRRGVIACPRL